MVSKKATKPQKAGKRLRKKEEGDCWRKRERNNIAVKRSREKAHQQRKVTLERVQFLREESQSLQDRVQLLSKELSILKNVLVHCATAGKISHVLEPVDGDATGFKTGHKYTVVTQEQL